MILATIALVIVVAICIIAASSSDRAKAQRDQLQFQENSVSSAQAANIPTAFKEIFSEEFPEYGESITYAKSDEFLRVWRACLDSKGYKKHLKRNGAGFKNSSAELEAAEFILSQSAPAISEQFHRFSLQEPPRMAKRIQSLIESSKLKAQGM